MVSEGLHVKVSGVSVHAKGPSTPPPQKKKKKKKREREKKRGKLAQVNPNVLNKRSKDKTGTVL